MESDAWCLPNQDSESWKFSGVPYKRQAHAHSFHEICSSAYHVFGWSNQQHVDYPHPALWCNLKKCTGDIITSNTPNGVRPFLFNTDILYVFTMLLVHDDVIKWKHFPRNWPFVRGIHRSPVNSPHKDQWRGALMFSLICHQIYHQILFASWHQLSETWFVMDLMVLVTWCESRKKTW